MGFVTFLKNLFGKKEETILPVVTEAAGTEVGSGDEPLAGTESGSEESAGGAAVQGTLGAAAGVLSEDADSAEAVTLMETEKDDPSAEPSYYNPLIGIEAPEQTAYRAGGSISFQHVSSSTKSNGSLTDISFELKAGECAAFIGDAASGVRLIPGLLMHSIETREGFVLVDGINVRDYQTRALRERVHFVPDEAGGGTAGAEILILDAEALGEAEHFGNVLAELREKLPGLTVLIIAEDQTYAGFAEKCAFFRDGVSDGFLRQN